MTFSEDVHFSNSFKPRLSGGRRFQCPPPAFGRRSCVFRPSPHCFRAPTAPAYTAPFSRTTPPPPARLGNTGEGRHSNHRDAAAAVARQRWHLFISGQTEVSGVEDKWRTRHSCGVVAVPRDGCPQFPLL